MFSETQEQAIKSKLKKWASKQAGVHFKLLNGSIVLHDTSPVAVRLFDEDGDTYYMTGYLAFKFKRLFKTGLVLFDKFSSDDLKTSIEEYRFIPKHNWVNLEGYKWRLAGKVLIDDLLNEVSQQENTKEYDKYGLYFDPAYRVCLKPTGKEIIACSAKGEDTYVFNIYNLKTALEVLKETGDKVVTIKYAKRSGEYLLYLSNSLVEVVLPPIKMNSRRK